SAGAAREEIRAKSKAPPLVGGVRWVGLLGASELVADKPPRRHFADLGRVGLICRDHFFREGFIMRAVFDTMVTAPPLIWTQNQFDEAEAAIARALDLTLSDVAGELAA